MADKREVVTVLLFNELIDSDEKPKRGKTRDWIRKRKENGYFNNIIVNSPRQTWVQGYVLG